MPLLSKQTLSSFFLKGNHHQLPLNFKITVLQTLNGFFKFMKARVFSCDSESNFSIRCTQGFYFQHQNNADYHHWTFQNSSCGLWDTKYFSSRDKNIAIAYFILLQQAWFPNTLLFTSPLGEARGIQSQEFKNSSMLEHREQENPLPAPAHPSFPQEGEAELCQLQNKVAGD